MNNYIKQIIENYFDSEYLKNIKQPKKGINNINQYLSSELSSNDILLSILNEERSIIYSFNIVIDEILNIYKSNSYKTNEIIYTKYNYNNVKDECKLLNNENKDYPIYVIFSSESKNEYGSIKDRKDYWDKIIIEINLNILKISTDIEGDILDTATHEFLHARESYALPDKDILASIKNRLFDDKETNIFKWDMFDKYFTIAASLVYYLKGSEQRAHINAVYNKINRFSDKYIKSIYTKEYRNIVDACFDQVENFSNYYFILKQITLLENIATTIPSALEPIIYYCHKYKLIKTHLNKYNFDNKISPLKYPKENTDKIIAGIVELKSILLQFKIKVKNIIYYNLQKRNIL